MGRKKPKTKSGNRNDDQAQAQKELDLANVFGRYRGKKKKPKKPVRGEPVPLNKRWHGFLGPSKEYSDGQIDTALRVLDEVSAASWPGPRSFSNECYRYQLEHVYQLKTNFKAFYELVANFRKSGINPNIRPVYHGTGDEALVGILTKGLIPGTQGMFGAGIYVAPDIKKAINYTGLGGARHFVFFGDALLGNPLVAEKGFDPNYESLWAEGQHCVHGKAQMTASYKNTLNYDEYCLPYRNQINLRLLGCYTSKGLSILRPRW